VTAVKSALATLTQVTLFKEIDSKRVGLLFSLVDVHPFAAAVLKVALAKSVHFFPHNAMPEIFFPTLERSFSSYLKGHSDHHQTTTEVSNLLKLVTKARTFTQMAKFHERGIEYVAKSAKGANWARAIEFFSILLPFLGKMSATDAARL